MNESYYIGWGTLALINAALANIDRRSPLKYFIGSMLLGPFVTLVRAATREDERDAFRQIDLWRGRRSSVTPPPAGPQ